MSDKNNYHSRSYHKFFEDWAEWNAPDKDGNIRVQRVYVGNYYRSPLHGKKCIVHKILYALLYGSSVTCFILSGIKNIPVNHALIPALISAACIFALAVLALPLWCQLTMPEEMIVRQYRAASLDLIQKSGIAAAALAAAMLADLLFLLRAGDGTAVRETLLCACGHFAAAGSVLILRHLEKRLDYIILPSRASRPENSTVIQFQSAEQHF